MKSNASILILALIAPIALTACSDKQNSSVSPVPDKSTGLLQMIPGGLIDACALVPSADLAALLGDNYDAKSNTVLATNNNEQFQKSGDCKILSSKGASKIYYAVFVGKDEASISANFKQGLWAANNNRVMPGLKTQDLSGIGTNAYTYNYKFGPGFANSELTLVGQNGPRLVTVTLQNFTGDIDSQTSKAGSLAIRLLGKL